MQIVVTEPLRHILYKPVLCGGLLHRRHRTAFARQKLKADSPGAGKKVESVASFKIGQILNNVEYILTGKVGGRPRRDICRHIESPTSVFSSNYSHSIINFKSKGASWMSGPAFIIGAGTTRGIT